MPRMVFIRSMLPALQRGPLTSMLAAEVTAGAFFFVERGTANSNRGYVLQAKTGGGAYTVGTDALVFSQFSGAGQIDAGGWSNQEWRCT